MKNPNKFFGLLAAAMILLASCSGSDGDTMVTSPEAEARGQADARALCERGLEVPEHEFHAALLAVKAREWDMRQRGQTVEADVYISAFKEYVAEHDKVLADTIL